MLQGRTVRRLVLDSARGVPVTSGPCSERAARSAAPASRTKRTGVTLDDTKIIVRQQNSNAGVKRGPNGTFVVDQREVLASTKNMSQVLTQARALPYVEGGKTVGFRINEIVPGSIYTKIGLQNGDVIQRVNSQELDNPAKFFQLYQGLQNERSIVIDLIRNGQPQTLNYEIR